MTIVVEGIDAAGKTTLCNSLVKKLGGIVYSTPPGEFKKEREKVGTFVCPYHSYSFYFRGLQVASGEIDALKVTQSHIFIDRHWISTAASHLIQGVDLNLADLVSLDCADFTVLLLVNPQIQFNRLKRRGMSLSDKRLLKYSSEISDCYQQLTLKYCRSSLIIDTSDMTESEVLKHVMEGVFHESAILFT